MSDLVLARRLLAGEEAAFDEFFGRDFPGLYRFALSRVGSHEDAAEELAQRALIRGLAGLHTYRGEAALFTWLCALCRREIAAWREQQGRRHEVSLFDDHPEVRDALDAMSAGDDDAEAMLLRKEVGVLVHLTLDCLPDRYGDILEWKYIQGLSVTEIAARLGVGYKAAESLLSRARAAFRDGFLLLGGAWPGLTSIAGPLKDDERHARAARRRRRRGGDDATAASGRRPPRRAAGARRPKYAQRCTPSGKRSYGDVVCAAGPLPPRRWPPRPRSRGSWSGGTPVIRRRRRPAHRSHPWNGSTVRRVLRPALPGRGRCCSRPTTPCGPATWSPRPRTVESRSRFPGATSVRLDVGSRLRVLSENAVELLAGAVYIDTGGETTRFEVRTAFATARDVGTQFEVRLLDGAVRLRVRAGAVVLSGGGRSVTAQEDTEVVMSGDGTESRPIAPDDDVWSWVTGVAPPVDFEGLTLADFLDRLASEQGWAIQYAEEPLAKDAAGFVLHGSARGLTPREAVEVAISTTGLRHRFEGRTLHVLRGEGQRRLTRETMPGLQRQRRWHGAMVLTAALALTPVTGVAQSAGEPLTEALRGLQARGLRIVFSSATVTEGMRVARDPRSSAPRQQLDELLAPHGLRVRQGPAGILEIVRGIPAAKTRPSAPVARGPDSLAPADGTCLQRVRHRQRPRPVSDRPGRGGGSPAGSCTDRPPLRRPG